MNADTHEMKASVCVIFYLVFRKKYEDLSQKEKKPKSSKAHKREVEAEYSKYVIQAEVVRN